MPTCFHFIHLLFKYSVFDEGDSMSLKSSSFMSSQEKHQCNTSASALYSLGAKVDKMSKTFAHGFAQESKAHSHPDQSPQRRAKVAKSFQRLERGLTNEKKVTIMDLFETNTVAVDMFLAVDLMMMVYDGHGSQTNSFRWVIWRCQLMQRCPQCNNERISSWDSF